MIRIVSLTVTEKGYCHDPATGALNEAHPDIVHDLENPSTPRSAPGFILAALARRRGRGVPPFTVLCCDNLPANGRTVHRVLSRMASLMEPAFGDYVRSKVSCPATMVDRIVPATTDEDRARVSAALGVEDAWPVMAEPFSQWAIEDDFPLGPTALGAGGRRVRARCSSLRADEAPAPQRRAFEPRLPRSGARPRDRRSGERRSAPRRLPGPALERAEADRAAPEGTDLAAYCARLLERFRNPAIRHRLAQIAMDGSQKLPQRLLAATRDNLAAGRSIESACRAVAAFALHASGTDGRGRRVEVRDPLAADLAAALSGVREQPGDALERFLGLRAVFGMTCRSRRPSGAAWSKRWRPGSRAIRYADPAEAGARPVSASASMRRTRSSAVRVAALRSEP